MLYVVANTPGAEYFRVSINITSVPYHMELADRTSEDFRELAEKVRAEVEFVYRDVKGQQSINVLQFRLVIIIQRNSDHRTLSSSLCWNK